ncbi:hypothetical protein VNO80_24527 [Phaseolus coccineus]|uniref:Uncharacterized protein n=1 Tax=Phaseolus coccineus TaxID=3886 RepID=A0AAN9LSZ6_PHACN
MIWLRSDPNFGESRFGSGYWETDAMHSTFWSLTFMLISRIQPSTIPCNSSSYPQSLIQLKCLYHQPFVSSQAFTRESSLHDHILLELEIMGRGRGKGKKLSVGIGNEEDGIVSGEEEGVPKQKRRGRPQKVLKDEFNEEEIEEMEEDVSGDSVKNVVSGKEMKNPNSTKQGRKRKRNLEEKMEVAEEKSGVRMGSKIDGLTKSKGFRQNGSRRKSKPCRAAEAGVLCKQDYA